MSGMRENAMSRNDDANTSGARPTALDDANVVGLDVREHLRRGEEPFRVIMDAVDALGEDQVLRLRAIFEPVPLYAVLARKGFQHWTEKLDEDDWRVWFYRAGGIRDADEGIGIGIGDGGGGGDGPAVENETVVLDVRGLEPPEPLVRTLEALETLPNGATLVQLNVRVPQFLLPQLKSRGFTYEIERCSDELTRVHIRRAGNRAEPMPDASDG